MMYLPMSLANKYRPSTFDNMIGQEHITDILKAKVQMDKGGHTNFLLFGPRWTGKTSSARILAKAINCLDLHDGNPCNACANCQIINEGKTLDYVEIDAASHTGVDNIREEILDKASYPPSVLKKKVYVIDEVHMLSTSAFNALLKTIEEPRDTMLFILATTEIQKVPETIISRCQVFNFRKVPAAEMIVRLWEICEKEGLTATPAALQLIAKVSEWCVRDAIKYLDQVSVFGNIDEDHVSKFLGIASDGLIEDMITAIRGGNFETIVATIENCTQKGIDLQHFAKQMVLYLDSHLLEDVKFFISLSTAFTEILQTIRYYSYPAIVYKIVLYNFLNPNSVAPVVAAPAPRPVAPTPSPAPVSPVAPSVAPVVEKTAEAPAPIQVSNGSQDLLGQLLTRIDKDNLKRAIQDHSSILSQENGVITLSVINKMSQIMIDNTENKGLIENILSEITGQQTFVKTTFVSKESMFQGGLL